MHVSARYLEMTTGGAEHHVLWHCSLLSSSEHAWLRERDDGSRLEGIVAAPLGDVPCHIEYTVTIDAQWRAGEARAVIATPTHVREITLHAGRTDGWELNGVRAPSLDNCYDIDLGWTPATNTIPIRRLDLEIGESASIAAAWVRFPELDVVSNEQRYTRLASDRWRYQSGDFDFELITDPGSGLVVTYGDELWRAAAMSHG
jgi:hypothetical protein